MNTKPFSVSLLIKASIAFDVILLTLLTNDCSQYTAYDNGIDLILFNIKPQETITFILLALSSLNNSLQTHTLSVLKIF